MSEHNPDFIITSLAITSELGASLANELTLPVDKVFCKVAGD